VNAAAAVEWVAREAYGRLLARLVARYRDVAACEDALADALADALRTWPERGVPSDPVAWLRTAAKNRLLDSRRHDAITLHAEATLSLLAEEERTQAIDPRLPLLFACAHPAIDPRARTALVLQVVLGLEASVVARAFATSPTAMAKRLVRAKDKMRHAGIPFELPEPDEWVPRLATVLDAIYGAYGLAWDFSFEASNVADVRDESLYLAQLVHDALPDEAEPKALLALMWFCEARARARLVDGAFVPLDEQDVGRWDLSAIDRAQHLLESASRAPTLARFQLEAAIQACHVARRLTGADNRAEIVLLYRTLVALHLTEGAALGLVAAVAAAEGAPAGLDALETVPSGSQPYWALRADLLLRADRKTEALEALERAVALTADRPVRAWLEAKRQASSRAPG
jgi:RNA polymerase sigma-70 factor (ECF subfamily)